MNKAVIIVEKISGLYNESILVGDKFRDVIDLNIFVGPVKGFNFKCDVLITTTVLSSSFISGEKQGMFTTKNSIYKFTIIDYDEAKEQDIRCHQSHCCVNHGCKYGDPNCPVERREVLQRYECELCSEPLSMRLYSYDDIQEAYKAGRDGKDLKSLFTTRIVRKK